MKTNEVLGDLRRRICDGEFAPGAQLPLRSSLLKHYNSSTDTLQKVVNALIKEQFLESCGPNGTRVSQYPPHIYEIGIVIPLKREKDEIWDSFFECIVAAAKECMKSGNTPYRFRFYYNIDRHNLHSDEFLKLVRDVEFRRLAGVIVLQQPSFSDKMVEKIGNIPIVFFTDLAFDQDNIICLFQDYPGIMRIMGEELRRRHLCCPFVLGNTGISPQHMKRWLQSLEQVAGIDVNPDFFQAVSLNAESTLWYTQLLKLAFGSARKPDSVVVLNENILPYIMDFFQGQFAGIPIISHCNFPLNSKRRFNDVTWVGLDVRSALLDSIFEINHCLHRQKQQRRLIQAVRESEVPSKFDWSLESPKTPESIVNIEKVPVI